MTEIDGSNQPLTTPVSSIGAGGDDDTPRVHLLMAPGRDRRLLREWLTERFQVSTGIDDDAIDADVDLYIIDCEAYRKNEAWLKELKRQTEPAFLPFLVFVQSTTGIDDDLWEFADDIVQRPVRWEILQIRLANLLHRRETSKRLAERSQTLSETVSELRLKERSMDAAPIGVTITDPSAPDNPLIYANAAFERLTGYDTEEVLGRNMRFLQGLGTDPTTIARLHEAINDERPISVTILNYRKDGSRFWNRLEIAPVRDEAGTVTNFVGFQTDVTDQKISQQRLAVLNRLIRHNLSNEINVIDGYTDNLLAEVDDPAVRETLEIIKESAEDLKALGTNASRVERLLSRSEDGQGELWNVCETMVSIRNRFAEEYPAIDLSVDIEEGPWYIRGVGFDQAMRELVENAVVHNDGGSQRVDITVGPLENHENQFAVCIEDNGPGLPPGTLEILENGEETPLHHTDGLGLWMVSWLVANLGGSIDIASDEGEGTVVRVTLPSHGSSDS